MKALAPAIAPPLVGISLTYRLSTAAHPFIPTPCQSRLNKGYPASRRPVVELPPSESIVERPLAAEDEFVLVTMPPEAEGAA
jgi:hypothetical protein